MILGIPWHSCWKGLETGQDWTRKAQAFWIDDTTSCYGSSQNVYFLLISYCLAMLTRAIVYTLYMTTTKKKSLSWRCCGWGMRQMVCMYLYQLIPWQKESRRPEKHWRLEWMKDCICIPWLSSNSSFTLFAQALRCRQGLPSLIFVWKSLFVHCSSVQMWWY